MPDKADAKIDVIKPLPIVDIDKADKTTLEAEKARLIDTRVRMERQKKSAQRRIQMFQDRVDWIDKKVKEDDTKMVLVEAQLRKK